MTTEQVPLAEQIAALVRQLDDENQRLARLVAMLREDFQEASDAADEANERIARLEGALTFARDRMRGFVGGAYTKRECTHGIDTNGEDCPDCIDAYFMEAIDHIAALSPAEPG